MEPKILALGNLIIQFIIIGLIGYAGYIAKWRKALKKHCNLMRIAVAILVVTTAGVMLPALLGYTGPGVPASWLYVEMWVHHGLGLLVLVIFIYSSLAFSKIIRTRRRLVFPMRIATAAWLVSFGLGVHLYIVIWI
jgi:putative membrane protein